MSNYYGSKGTFRSRSPREEVDPMSSMGSFGDLMLVFACGLMVALVVAWNVDLAEFNQVELGEEIEDVQDFEGAETGGNSTYVEMGTVYQDAATGQYYLMEQEVDTGLDSEEGENADANANGAANGAAGNTQNDKTGGE